MGRTPQLCLPAVVTALPSRQVHCKTATFPTHANVEGQETRCRARTAPQRGEVADTTPNNNSGYEGFNKRGQDKRPARTSLPEQKTVGEEACRELCSNGPSTEQIMDVIGGSSQEEQLFCFDTYLPRETAASASTFWVALKDVSSTHLFLAPHKQPQRQDTGYRHSPVATTSPDTQHYNHVLALGLHLTANQSEAGHTSAASC